MGFRAQEAVEPLDYDFSPYGGAGTMPEPTRDRLDGFQQALASAADAFGLDRQTALRVAAHRDDPAEAFAALTGEQVERLTDPAARGRLADTMLAALADFCGGHPSREELEALPPRTLEAFQGWLVGLFFGGNPTQPSAATRRSPALLNGAGAAG